MKQRIERTAHTDLLLCFLLGIVAVLLCGCAGTSPVLRQGLDKLSESAAHSASREAVLRKLVGQAWRVLAEVEAEKGLRADVADGGASVEQAMARLRKALDQIDRGRLILDGYEAEAAAQAASERRLRDAMAGALRELEERSAAAEQLGDAMEAAAGVAGQLEAEKRKAKTARAEARRLEAERAAEEGEGE